MKLSLEPRDLAAYVSLLVEREFPDGVATKIPEVFEQALDRVDRCFSHIALRGYSDAEGATFNHLHGDQFASFLYLLSRCAWEAGDESGARKLSLLNRMRHAIVIMPDTKLPDIFCIPHTVGTVIGKGDYSDFLVVCQNVTIANDITTWLTIGRGVILFPGAFVVGTGRIGDGAVITANSTLSYVDVPPDSMVRGASPDITIWPRKRNLLSRYFTDFQDKEEAAR